MQYSIKTVQVGQRDQDLLKMPPIFSKFPVEFKAGVIYTKLEAQCAECGQIIKDENLHGEVVPVLPNMTQIEARGYCHPCNLVTPVSYRLYADGRFMGIINGKWRTFYMKKSIPFWKKIIKFLF